jgi:hypothetical protein
MLFSWLDLVCAIGQEQARRNAMPFSVDRGRRLPVPICPVAGDVNFHYWSRCGCQLSPPQLLFSLCKINEHFVGSYFWECMNLLILQLSQRNCSMHWWCLCEQSTMMIGH